jgi:hypothetical protein
VLRREMRGTRPPADVRQFEARIAAMADAFSLREAGDADLHLATLTAKSADPKIRLLRPPPSAKEPHARGCPVPGISALTPRTTSSAGR